MPNLQLTAEQDAFLATPTSANFTASITGESGTGALACVVSPSFTTPILGIPTSGTLTNCTIPVGQITGAGAGVLTFLATPSGVNLATALTTALPATKGGTGLTALGTGIATALGVNANAGGGLIVLADPGADRLVFWDESAGVYTHLTPGTGLTITTTTIEATANANAVTLASAAAGAGLLIVSAGADRTATATDTVTTINATTVAATTITFGGATVGVRPVSKITAANYTIGTTDANELFGGVIYVTAAATITIPAVAAGASFTVITVGAVAVSVDPNAADLIVLDGVALSDGDKITNLSTAGDIAVFTYYDATGWFASTNGWTDTN